MAYIFKDINVRDPFVTDSKSLVLEDTKVVVQSVHRLLTTPEATIPYFRNYGIDIKKFSQYPLTDETIQVIYDYVKARLEAFETRATVESCVADANVEKGEIYYTFYIRVKATQEVAELPSWTVKLATY